MSTEKKMFEQGHGTSIYPENVDVLNRLYDVVGGNGFSLKYLLSKLPEFRKLKYPRGYDWFWIAELSVKDGTVDIFFPMCQDWHADLRLNRSIALFAEGVPEKQYLTIFQKVVDVFWDEYFLRSHHNPKRKLPDEIFSRILADGRKAVPMWYVDVRASLNPVADGDMFLSHLVAKKWFEDQGYVVI